MGIFRIYTKWAVENCPIWNFYAPRKPRNSKKKVATVFLDTLYFILNLEKFWKQTRLKDVLLDTFIVLSIRE